MYNEAFRHADPTKNTVRLCLFTQVKTTPVLDSFEGVRRALRTFKPINSVDGEAKLQHVVKGILRACLVEAEVSMRDHASLVIVAPDGSRDVRFTVDVSDLAVS